MTQLFNALLSEAGCSVLTASNGENGLTLMRSEPIDLVLTDFMMPSLNGLEFARAVRTQTGWSDTTIVFMSANEQPGYLARALELGAVDYVPKCLGAETIILDAIERGLADVSA
jgi:CheY-like chemotaxis protein